MRDILQINCPIIFKTSTSKKKKKNKKFFHNLIKETDKGHDKYNARHWTGSFAIKILLRQLRKT